MNDVVVRPAVPDDAGQVAEVHLAARRAAPMPAGIHTDDEVRGWLLGRLSLDQTWIAALGVDIVGYARCTQTWLDDLYVDPGHQGQGIGSALLGVVKATHPEGFGLWVFESNAPARAFYRAQGLREVERTDGSANEEREPDIRCVWQPDRH
ncbi:MAG: N-acetyltransferase family protein [Nocardioides sp.]